MSKKSDEKRIRSNRNVFYKYLLLYLLFFLLVSVIITSSIVIFGVSFEFTLAPEDAAHGAIITVAMIIVISLFILAVYIMIQHFAVNKPIERIRDYLQHVSEGNFDTKLERGFEIFGLSQFNSMIDDINTTVGELQNIQTFRTDFINNISHEAKTPISVILNYSKLLEEENLSDDLRIKYSKKIYSAADDLNSLVITALNINRIEHQKIFPNHESFDLSEHLVQSIFAYETKFEDKNINLQTDFDEGIIIDTDKRLLQLVWNNLISNAIKFSKEGGTVRIEVHRFDDVATVSVSDNGRGIDDSDKPHIFDKYFRSERVSDVRGNGLGLALVKNITDALEMNISFDSELGVGTTFVVSINM